MGNPRLRIGVDVGGTNTDGVILDPTDAAGASRGIVAWKKSSTTPDPSDGIDAVIRAMFAESGVAAADVASVTIGTTHFINAVVEMDRTRLARVAVIRLCGPFSQAIPLGADWPPALRRIICAHRGLVAGGLEIDGSPIAALDEAAVRRECAAIRAKGIRSVAVVGVFSPIDVVAAGPDASQSQSQEERAAAVVRDELGPGADVVLSRDVANIGFLERENAAALNAAILPFARRTVRAFEAAVARLGLACPVFVTQNDGTVLSAAAAARVPIRTFSSGPTNSMRGAAYLTRELDNGGDGGGGGGGKGEEAEAMMVVDIGGTTTDVGLLLPNGFPRQAAAFSEVAGVRTNFSYPDVRSIGLGGGSVVRKAADGRLTIGPDSVGYRIREEALVFGGDVATATDYTVLGDASVRIGERSRVTERAGGIAPADLAAFQAQLRAMLERIIDTMKTSPRDLPVVLVGGGAVIAPDALAGASRVVKPPWSGVANAVGAATARVSGAVDAIESTESRTVAQAIEALSRRAVDDAVRNGARRETVSIAEVESFPLQYVANQSRIIIKAVGDFDFARAPNLSAPPPPAPDGPPDDDFPEHPTAAAASADNDEEEGEEEATQAQGQLPPSTPAAIDAYRPRVAGRTWHLSETDAAWIAAGCYVLGTGGGGSPYQHLLRLRGLLRGGAAVRVVAPQDLPDDALVACGGAKGSPQVSVEKPYGDEILESQRELYAYLGTSPDAVIPLEIGGGNGLQGLLLGATPNLDVPAIDGDWMGRAYPISHMTTPVVFGEEREERAVMVPSCISDGNGRIMLMTKARTELDAERAFRAALSTMGSHVGCAKAPVRGADLKRWVVANTVSLAWRIGRAAARCRAAGDVDQVAEAIVAEASGGGGDNDAARVLFRGKIVAVDRVTRAGHAYGEVVIEAAGEAAAAAAPADEAAGGPRGRERLVIPFKNENILAKKLGAGQASDERGEILAMVPDLVSVLDAQDGEALGTQDYRYGLLVVVIGITASDKWTSTARGLQIGGPEGFGIKDLEYKPLGTFRKPRSVIDEFDQPT
ncbi:hypothetical protein GGR56DRAFT_693571 [Xylariaceae sp. FL0804]|nr:hypothetical protein GGR56DRAFT_693571 [Xylariaceae sp. FL0804]